MQITLLMRYCMLARWQGWLVNLNKFCGIHEKVLVLLIFVKESINVQSILFKINQFLKWPYKSAKNVFSLILAEEPFSFDTILRISSRPTLKTF